MKLRNLIQLVFVIILTLNSGSTHAGTDGGRTASDFLNIGIGAQAAGMGGAYSSVSEGVLSSYWNPAGLTSLNESEVIFGHFLWFQDISLEHASGAHNLNDRTSLAASITYLNYGTIEGYNSSGNPTGDITAYDFAGALSVGFKLNEQFSAGLTGKLISQKLDDINGSTFAVDLGAKYLGDRFNVAAVVSNLGMKMKFNSVEENLPLTVKFGASTYLLNQRLLTAIDLEKQIYGNSIVRHGFEYNFNGQYFLRSGYNFYPSEDVRALGTGINLGAGVILNQIELDYAFTIREKYASEDLHRFSILFRFNN